MVALPRLNQFRAFDVRGASDEVVSMIRYARKLAIARQTPVFVNVDVAAGQVCLNFAASAVCEGALNPVPGPSGNTYIVPSRPLGLALATATPSFSFNTSGAPSTGAVILNISGGGMTRVLTVAAETGYVSVQ